MKLYRKILALVAVLSALSMAVSCDRTQLEEITEIDLGRCLQPLNLTAKLSQGQNVTFGWDVSKDAEKYILEVYTDEQMQTLSFSEEIQANEVPVTKTLDVDSEYWFRVRACNASKELSKWSNYDKSIKTFAVKSNLYMSLAGRDANSISLSWTADPEVDRIEYSWEGAEEPGVYTLTQGDIANGSATVPGLAPSTQYDLVLYYSSANRGEVVAWTLPDPKGLVEVKTSAALAQGITDGASMLLSMEGSPYSIGADIAKGLDVSKGFKLYGNGGADGSKPVVYGCLGITDAFDGAEIFIEGVELNGMEQKCGFLIQHKEGSTTDGVSVGGIIFRNCDITAYSKGLFYEWGKTLKIGEFTFDNCFIHEVNADGGNGGDGFDVRQATEISKLNIINNTIINGFRTFLRIDANPVIGDVVFENNTISNICFVDNTNNAGVIAFQTTPSSFSFKNNLFVNMPEKSYLTRDNAKYKDGANLNLSAGQNYFYNVNDGFFTPMFTLAHASGKVLSVDPCFNARAGKFNIIGGSEISGAGIGAPQWWIEYVEAPEDLTMYTIEGNHTWDFNDGKYFSTDVAKSMVRDFLFMGVSSNKITVLDGKLGFTAAATTSRKGVPTDGYLAFQVKEAGSLIIKPVDEAASESHFVVGVGPLSGSSISIKGGASALSDMGKAQKIVIKDITEESLIYIYPTGPIGLEQLAWSTDVSDVNTALPTPMPSINPKTITAGEPQDIVVSWEAVEGAGSYSVVFNGKTYPADETLVGETPRFTIGSTTIGMLDPGSYTVNVYANPDKNNIYNTMSEAGVAAFAIQPKAEQGEEGGAFIVKNVDELVAALGAKKEDITLAASGSPFVLTEALAVDYPVTLTGEDGTVVEGAVALSGEIAGNVTIKNLTFDDKNTGKGCFLTLPDGLKMGNLIVEDVNLKSYSKSAIYGNFETTSIDNIVFRHVNISDWGTGQGVFDLRKGTYGSLKLVESTFVGGRDFIRMDAACVCGEIIIRSNTMDKLNCGVNGNGILYVRADVANFVVSNNLWLNEVAEGKTVLLSKTSGVKVPQMRNNFFYNIDETNFFSGLITREIATNGGGVVLSTNPVKNAESGDYTLVNGLAISNRVGDPRWNTSFDPGSSSGSFAVKDTAELWAAISAGKTAIVLEEGNYELKRKLNVVKDMRLTANGEVSVKGYVHIEGEDLGTIVLEGIHFIFDGSNGNAINVAASSANAVFVKNCIFDGYSKSIYYDNTGMQANSLVLNGNKVINHGTGQGVFDIRKGSYNAVNIEQNTIVGGRELIRADANTIKEAFTFRNNTVDGSNLGVNGNGIIYVRATPTAFVFNNNLFINEVKEEKTVMLSKASGVSIPTEAKTNFFYNIDQANFFAGVINKEVAAAVEISNCPVKDAASGDYTLVDALAMASNVGARCWNPSAGIVSTDFTVNNTEELINAISVGKTAITLNYGVYDFTATESLSGGIMTLNAPLTLKGVSKAGAKPQIIGGFKLGEGTSAFIAQGIAFDGKDKSLGIVLDVAGILENARISLKNCDIMNYSKSVYYNGSSFTGSVSLFSVSGCNIGGFGNGQGLFDIRKGSYTTLLIENSTIYNGGRDFIRADAGVVSNSIAIKNNSFASTGIGAGNGLFWVRSTPNSYVIESNLFVNEYAEGSSTLLAKAGATKAEFKNNHFFNCDADKFWSGTYTMEEGTANGGSVLSSDPCVNSAEWNFTLVNTELKAAKVGAPKWF